MKNRNCSGPVKTEIYQPFKKKKSHRKMQSLVSMFAHHHLSRVQFIWWVGKVVGSAEAAWKKRRVSTTVSPPVKVWNNNTTKVIPGFILKLKKIYSKMPNLTQMTTAKKWPIFQASKSDSSVHVCKCNVLQHWFNNWWREESIRVCKDSEQHNSDN